VSHESRTTSLSHGDALDGLPVEAASEVEQWLDALAQLPPEHWFAVGRACASDVSGRRRRATARALLEAIVADQRIALTAWFIRDMVQTAAHSAAGAASRARPSARRDFATARSAAAWATLAIATQAWLPCVDRQALCAPFDAVIGNGALRRV
jgi:hypothetical protein